MNTRIYINPTYSPSDHTEGGIRRVIEAQMQHLASFGCEVVDSPDSADLIVNHGTLHETRPGIPMVAACHGLYWAGYDWDAWAYDANREVTENMLRADAITVPSNWVGRAVSRGLWRPTHTIYHGINVEEWPESVPQGYVLWNKARTDPVSDQRDLDKLAEMLPHVSFVTTFGQPRANVRVVGVHPLHVMRKLVQGASAYLCTARETFGIGTIEALASGVPVVGWKYGGQEEVIIEGETGHLVEPGDFDALAMAVEAVLSRGREMGRAARDDAWKRWQWHDKVGQYALLYQDLVKGYKRKRPRVSVVITCYNLGKFVNAAFGSVIDQTMAGESWELIVVDDCSTDNSYAICQQLEGYYQGRGKFNIRLMQTPENCGLSGARNYGALRARGDYLIFLDADDMLERNALTALADRLDRDKGVDIVYGMLDVVNEQGEDRRRNQWPTGNFSWKGQTAHLNQLPYASMMRYRVFGHTGGYRTRDWRAEDAGFWLRASSFGYRVACATTETVLVYRVRSASKSGVERANHPDADGDWTAWFPWRLGAASGAEGEEVARSTSGVMASRLVPFGAQGKPPAQMRFWPVRHFQHPAVSVIIPVTVDHEQYIVDALDSVMAQTCPEWEVIIVQDAPLPSLNLTYPWATIITTGGAAGAGKARNLGLHAARAPLVLFLDADDVLHPQALEKMLARYAATGGYIYSDTLLLDEGAQVADAFVRDLKSLPVYGLGQTTDVSYSLLPSGEWDQRTFLESGYDLQHPGQHSVTALVATVDALGVGGFDEQMAALEDWEFYLRLAASGVTGHRIPEPLLAYRLWTGRRRRDVRVHQDQLVARMAARYAPFVRGDKPMCSCGSGGGGQRAQRSALDAVASMLPPDGAYLEGLNGLQEGVMTLAGNREVDATVRLEYVGDHYGAITYKGPVTRQNYRAGLEPAAKFVDVQAADVEHLMLSGAFRRVQL